MKRYPTIEAVRKGKIVSVKDLVKEVLCRYNSLNDSDKAIWDKNIRNMEKESEGKKVILGLL